MLAWLQDKEPARSRVEELLGLRPLMSWINVVEVYYRLERVHDRASAEEVLSGLRRTLELELPGTARMLEAARLKAVHPIALADAFAVATAAAHRRILLTGDPEIIGRGDLPCAVEDLRAPGAEGASTASCVWPPGLQ